MLKIWRKWPTRIQGDGKSASSHDTADAKDDRYHGNIAP